MQALTSYLRHLIVTGLCLLVAKFELPLAGAEEAANVLGLFIVGTVTWAIAKYLPALAKRLGLLAVFFFLPMGCADFPRVPVTTSVLTPAGSFGYSSKAGLLITVDQRSGK